MKGQSKLFSNHLFAIIICLSTLLYLPAWISSREFRPQQENESYVLVIRRDHQNIVPEPVWGDIIHLHKNAVLLRVDTFSSAAIPLAEYLTIPLDKESVGRIIEEEDETGYLYYDPSVLDNPLVDAMISAIQTTELSNKISHLENYQTRFFLNPNRYEIISWLENEFLASGFTDVVIDSFYIEEYNWGQFPPLWQSNLIATIPGSTHPDNVILIGAHFDSIISSQFGDPMEIAPGADDNASGISAMLEIARVLKDNDYKPRKTLKFVAFGAEEIGLMGSIDYSRKIAATDYRIELMLNNDMISYSPPGSDDWKVYLYPYRGFTYLADLTEDIFSDYTTVEPVRGFFNNPASDSFPFFLQKIPSLFLHEYHFNPHYHSPDDLLEYCDIDYALEITTASLLTILYHDLIPVPVKEPRVVDSGDGTGLIVHWSYPAPEEIDQYRIYFGTAPGNYSQVTETTDTEFHILGLAEGSEYFIGISALSNEGFEGFITEISKIPSAIPATPRNFSISAEEDHVVLNWQPNLELDLAGYNIYRSREGTNNEPTLYVELHTETQYLDNNLEDLIYYNYSITAVDEEGNESYPTEIVKTRLFSRSQGIVLIDTRSAGSVDYLMPDPWLVFRYYDTLLSNYRFHYTPLSQFTEVSLLDFAPYSTIILINDSICTPDYSTNLAVALGEYLAKGGNLLIAGFYPLYHFTQERNYPQIFEEESFVYKYLGISTALHSIGSLFGSAIPVRPGFPELQSDTAKTEESFDHHLMNIIGFSPVQEDRVAYIYDSQYSEHLPSGAMQGLCVGIDNSDNYKAVTLSFPLYYMQETDVALLFEYILLNLFQEVPWQIEEVTGLDRQIYILPNYPNPFWEETIIPCYLKEEGQISLTVYNIKGQKIRTLYNGFSKEGRHLHTWNGRDDKGIPVASGIYIGSLIQNEKRSVSRILLIR